MNPIQPRGFGMMSILVFGLVLPVVPQSGQVLVEVSAMLVSVIGVGVF